MFICFDLIQKVICKAYFVTSRHLRLFSCVRAYSLAKYIKRFRSEILVKWNIDWIE